MAQLKVATFNVEWMYSLFGATWKQWDGTIPNSFPGKQLGPITLEPIEDIPALCARIAGVMLGIEADIIAIQEGPPRKDQLQLFVQQFMNDDFQVFTSNSTTQTIHALVHRSIAEQVTALAPYREEMKGAWTKIPFQPWGTIAAESRKSHKCHRRPLVMTFEADSDRRLDVIVVHTKSKYSKLKTKEQWENREPEAVLDALDTRQKLSAEVYRLREYIEQRLTPADENRALLVMGDLNDGALAEEMEREFLIHNIIDELVGSVLTPSLTMRHAMTPSTLETATTTAFADPFQDNQIVEVLIDHLLVSPGLWHGAFAFSLVQGSCQVEEDVYEQFSDDDPQNRVRQLRPSDHKPVSAVVEY